MKFPIVLCLFGLALSENLHGRPSFGPSSLSQYGPGLGYGTNSGYLPNLGYGRLPYESTLEYGNKYGRHGTALGYGSGQGYNGWHGGSSFNAPGVYSGNRELSAYRTNSAYSGPAVSTVSQYSIHSATPLPYSPHYGGAGALPLSSGYGRRYGHEDSYGKKW